MTRPFKATIAVAVAAFAAPTFALAQMTAPGTSGVSVRVGAVFPVTSNARNNATVLPALGADIRLLKLGGMSYGDSSISLSADWFGRGSYSQAPVLLNWVVRDGAVFFDAGAGAGFGNEPSKTAVNFAYQGGVGYDLPGTGPTKVFVEAKYWGSDRSDLTGFGAYLGFRF